MSQQDFVLAVQAFWDIRARQALTGGGEGSGAAVRGGRHFSGVEALVKGLFHDAGFADHQLVSGASAKLPGYYRPTKNWDLVVRDGDNLIAAFEWKALGGPSFGNNFNNRAEEALGNATDVWKAYSAGSLGTLRPWLGYFFLIEDADGSQSRSTGTSFPSVGNLDPAFYRKNYCERAALMCERLLTDRLYDGVCFATTSRTAGAIPGEPVASLNWASFEAAVRARISYVESMGMGGEFRDE